MLTTNVSFYESAHVRGRSTHYWPFLSALILLVFRSILLKNSINLECASDAGILRDIFSVKASLPYAMDEQVFRKLRNLISTCPKSKLPWTELTHRDHPGVEPIKKLVQDFLVLVSGDDVTTLLDDILSPRQKEDVPALGNLDDPKGSKRVQKLATLLKKSPPLNPWMTLSNKKDAAVGVCLNVKIDINLF